MTPANCGHVPFLSLLLLTTGCLHFPHTNLLLLLHHIRPVLLRNQPSILGRRVLKHLLALLLQVVVPGGAALTKRQGR